MSEHSLSCKTLICRLRTLICHVRTLSSFCRLCMLCLKPSTWILKHQELCLCLFLSGDLFYSPTFSVIFRLVLYFPCPAQTAYTKKKWSLGWRWRHEVLSKMFICIKQATRRHIPENCSLHVYCNVNVRCRINYWILSWDIPCAVLSLDVCM